VGVAASEFGVGLPDPRQRVEVRDRHRPFPPGPDPGQDRLPPSRRPDPPGPRRQAHLARGIRRGSHIGSPRARAACRARSAPRPRSCGVSGTGSRDRSAGPSRRIPWHATTRSAVALRNRTGQRGRLHSSNLVGPRTGRKSTSEAIKNPGGAGGARTRDRQIMRSTLGCYVRLTCTNVSPGCHERTRGTGSSSGAGPRPGPR
jgi:hypothetical protein